jgi:hypothetical protein
MQVTHTLEDSELVQLRSESNTSIPMVMQIYAATLRGCSGVQILGGVAASCSKKRQDTLHTACSPDLIAATDERQTEFFNCNYN